MKVNLIVADPAWSFDDGLEMSDVKRGAKAQYDVLDISAIKALNVSDVAADDAVLALWVPSSLLQEGLDTMKAWGFRQTQTHIWVKIKTNPLRDLSDSICKIIKIKDVNKSSVLAVIGNIIETTDLNDMLAFGMGRLFRQTHEICLVGARGKVYGNLANKSQRSVHFDTNKKHSAKPEIIQNRLELMFPSFNKLELFARRQRNGWACLGNEAPMSIGEDIRESIRKLINISNEKMADINNIISCYDEGKSKDLFEMWKNVESQSTTLG